MSEQSTSTFTIIIKPAGEHCTIQAEGTGGIWVEPQPFPSRADLLTEAHEATLVEMAKDKSAVTSEAIRQLGRTLYDALFSPSIALAFGQACGQAKTNSIRLCLHIEVPDLATLPWEAMHDGQDWFITHSNTPLVRRFAQDVELSETLQVKGALRILFIGGGSPSKLPNLDASIKKLADDLQAALQESIDVGKIVFTSLFDADLKQLWDEMPKNYHIICFAGHGEPEGIYLKDEWGDLRPISAKDLAEKGLLERKSMRLVFLAACKTGAASQETLESLAQALSREAKVSAIIAMQYYVSMMKAGPLVRQFFVSLAAFQPVDVALAEARRTILGAGGAVVRDVVAPVLYLQAKDGALFRKARNWFKIALLGVLPVLMVLGIMLYLVYQRGQQVEQIKIANQLAAQSINQLDEDNWDLGLLLAVEAGRILSPTTETAEAFAALQQTFAYPVHTTFLRSGYSAWWGANGQFALTCSPRHGDLNADGDLAVWDVNNGTLQATLPISSCFPIAALKPDGKQVLVVDSKGILYGWEVQASQQFSIPIHAATISQAAWNNAGSHVLVAGCERYSNSCIEYKVWVLDAQTWEERPAPLSRLESINSVAWSANGNRILAVDGSQAWVWDVYTGQEFFLPAEHDAWLDQSGNRILTMGGAPDYLKKVWDVTTQTELFILAADTGWRLRDVAWSADSNQVMAVDINNKVWSWDCPSAPATGVPIIIGTHRATLPDSYETGWVSTMAWEANSKRILVAGCESGDGIDGSCESAARVWDVSPAFQTGAETGTSFSTFFPETPGPVQAAWSADDQRLLIIADKTLQVQDAATGAVLRTLTLSETILQATLSTDGNRVLVVSPQTVDVWNVTDGNQLFTLQRQASEFEQAKWSQDESRILTISGGTVQVWDTATQDELFPLSGGSSIVQASWNKDESFILTAAFDVGVAQVWDAMTGEKVLEIPSRYGLLQAEWSADGSHILTVGCNHSARGPECVEGETRVWTVSPTRKTFAATMVRLPHFPPVVGLLFSPPITDMGGGAGWNTDGSRILTMGDQIKIWDAQTGKELLVLPGRWAMWDTDEKHILTITAGGVRVWELGAGSTTANELFALPGSTKNDIARAIWRHDDTRILTISPSGAVRQYYTRLTDWLQAACWLAPRNMTWEEWRFMENVPYHKTCPTLPIHPSLIEAGQKLARNGDIERAVGIFRQALKLDSTLGFDPETEARKLAAVALVEKGQEFARSGDITNAVNVFRQAIELDGEIELEPETEARRLAAQSLAAEAQFLIYSDIQAAITTYAQVQELDPNVEITAWDWRNLCWFGSLDGYAQKVMCACDKAVELERDNGDYLNSRGLARALTEDYAGAVEDFKFAIEQWQKQSACIQGNVPRDRCAQLQAWIEVLEVERNPFDKETLDALR